MSDYWMAACPKCGWVGSSKDCEGGGQIADTGDYAEVVCPKCFKDGDGEWVAVEDAEEYLTASQAREAELLEKLDAAELLNSLQAQSITTLSQELEAAEARIKVSQNPDFYLSGDGYWVRGEDYEDRPDKHRFTEAAYRNSQTPPELAELQRENAELRKLLESKVPDWKSTIIDRLHSKVGVCMTCGQHKCPHVSNTTLPDTVQIDDVLWCINLDEYFFKEEIQPKESKQ